MRAVLLPQKHLHYLQWKTNKKFGQTLLILNGFNPQKAI